MDFLPRLVEKSVLRFFEDLATPRSLTVYLLYEAQEWDQLAGLRTDPKDYLEAESYWRDAAATSLLRKLDCLPTRIDRKAVAEAAFLASERDCFRTNLRLLPYLSPGLPETDKGVLEVILSARKICRRILGPLPPFNDGRHGPGSTFGDKGQLSTVPDKMSSAPTITPDAWPFLFEWVGTHWASACASSGRSPAFVKGNRFVTVPKDCTKDRGIAIEPSLNVFYQLGIGRVVRQRLLSSGIDLERGQEIHKQVACEASILGHLATIDLKSASDSISINLVKLILPPKWFEYLDDLRSKKTLFQGKWFLLEKFSSMGNGFTFELETLVFLCLIHGLFPALIPGKDLFVYGDDIIVPTAMSNDVISMLNFFGMSVNERKTFVDGPFRESCGGDFFLGTDVRPYYLKEAPNEPQQVIAFANGIRSVCLGRESSMTRCWLGLVNSLPTQIRRLRGPTSLGDLVIHDSEPLWEPKWRHSIRYFRAYKPANYRKVGWQNFRPEVVLASALYGVFSGGKQYEGVIPRDAVAGYRIGWVAQS